MYTYNWLVKKRKSLHGLQRLGSVLLSFKYHPCLAPEFVGPSIHDIDDVSKLFKHAAHGFLDVCNRRARGLEPWESVTVREICWNNGSPYHPWAVSRIDCSRRVCFCPPFGIRPPFFDEFDGSFREIHSSSSL